MSYTSPNWDAADIDLSGPYTSPAWSAADIEFVETAFQTLSPSSFTSDGFGSATVRNAADIVATGINDGAFGSATVYIRLVLQPSGIYDGGFGSASVYNLTQNVSATGIREDAFGTASLENLNRTIYAQRIDPTLTFGTAYIVGPRYVSGATAGDASAVGDPNAIGTRTIYPSGVDDAFALGDVFIAFSTREVRPGSILQFSDQVPAVMIANSARVVEPYAIDMEFGNIGDPIIGEPPFEVIWGAGVGDGSEFGDLDTEMIGPTRRIRPYWRLVGEQIEFFGTARIEPHTIHPAGINTSGFGRPWISNWIRYLDMDSGHKGISSARYGTLWISNYIRYVQPSGFDHSEVWWPFGPVPAGQAAAVRHVGDGKLYPGSINDGAFGDASVRFNLC